MQLILISLILVSCKNNSEKPVNDIDSKIIEKNKQVIDSLMSFNLYDTSKDSISKKWFIKKSSILKHLKEFDTISNYDWHQCYGSYECGVKGKVIHRNKLFNYHLNAGGWIHLITANNTKEEIFLGARNPKDTINFLSIYFCDENWD